MEISPGSVLIRNNLFWTSKNKQIIFKIIDSEIENNPLGRKSKLQSNFLVYYKKMYQFWKIDPFPQIWKFSLAMVY